MNSEELDREVEKAIKSLTHELEDYKECNNIELSRIDIVYLRNLLQSQQQRIHLLEKENQLQAKIILHLSDDTNLVIVNELQQQRIKDLQADKDFLIKGNNITLQDLQKAKQRIKELSQNPVTTDSLHKADLNGNRCRQCNKEIDNQFKWCSMECKIKDYEDNFSNCGTIDFLVKSKQDKEKKVQQEKYKKWKQSNPSKGIVDYLLSFGEFKDVNLDEADTGRSKKE